jgi:hypothetical protein
LSTVFQLRPVPMPSIFGVAFLKIRVSPCPFGNQKYRTSSTASTSSPSRHRGLNGVERAGLDPVLHDHGDDLGGVGLGLFREGIGGDQFRPLVRRAGHGGDLDPEAVLPSPVSMASSSASVAIPVSTTRLPLARRVRGFFSPISSAIARCSPDRRADAAGVHAAEQDDAVGHGRVGVTSSGSSDNRRSTGPPGRCA